MIQHNIFTDFELLIILCQNNKQHFWTWNCRSHKGSLKYQLMGLRISWAPPILLTRWPANPNCPATHLAKSVALQAFGLTLLKINVAIQNVYVKSEYNYEAINFIAYAMKISCILLCCIALFYKHIQLPWLAYIYYTLCGINTSSSEIPERYFCIFKLHSMPYPTSQL